MRDNDGPAVAELHRASILATSDTVYSAVERMSWAHSISAGGYAKAAVDGEVFEVAFDDRDRPVAFCSRKGDNIAAAYVHPNWQGMGIGSALLGRAERALAQAGYATARVHAANTAVSFYEFHGYQTVEAVKHRTGGGLLLNTTRLRKPLSS